MSVQHDGCWNRGRIIPALILLFVTVEAVSQDSTRTYQPLDEVVITAQHQGGNAGQAVHQIRVLDRERMDAQASQSLPELLQTELGIQLTEDPSTGTKIQLQGLAGQQVKILVDGVPVVGRLDGDIDLSQIPLNNIERIEIVEGPLSVEYGSNALGGVINLITKRPKTQTLRANATLLESTTGPGWSLHEGVHNADASVDWANAGHGAGIQVGRYFFGGRWDERTVRSKSWNPRRQQFVSANYGYQANRGNIRLKSQVFDETLLRPGEPEGIYQILALDETVQSLRQMHQLDGSYRWQNGLAWTGFVALSSLDRDRVQSRKDLVSLETKTLPGATKETFTGWSARGTFTRNWTGPHLSAQLGYDLLRESTTGDKILDGTQVQHDLAGFASVEWQPVTAVTLRPGIRAAWNDAYPAPLTPSFNARWQATENLAIRASWAKGFRAPSLKELYLDFVDINHNITGNPGLTAEYGQYVQASADWKRLSGKTFFRANLSTFYNQVTNRIELAITDSASNAFTYLNLDQITLTGAQLRGSIRQENSLLQAGANALLRQAPGGQWLPSWQANARIQWTFLPNSNLNVFYKFNGPSQAFINGSEDDTSSWQLTSLAAYHWIDLTVSKSFADKRLQVTTGVKNLLNVTSVNANGAIGGAHSGADGQAAISLGRSVFVRIQCSLEKRQAL